MNLLKIILSTSAFAIASVALHAQFPTKVESFPVRAGGEPHIPDWKTFYFCG